MALAVLGHPRGRLLKSAGDGLNASFTGNASGGVESRAMLIPVIVNFLTPPAKVTESPGPNEPGSAIPSADTEK